MTHYSKRMKIHRRLCRCTFGKAMSDSISRAIYSKKGEAEFDSLREHPRGASKGKLKKPIAFQGDVNLNKAFDGKKLSLWTEPGTELDLIDGLRKRLASAIDPKVKVHEEHFQGKGSTW